jgi:hypothetical protein
VTRATALAEIGRMRRWPEGEATTRAGELVVRLREELEAP